MTENIRAQFVRDQLHALLDRGSTIRAVLNEDRWSTWGELAEIAGAVEAELVARDVPPRGKVALVLRNRWSGLAAFLGLIAEGRVPALVSPIQPARSIAAAVDLIAPVAIVVDDDDVSDELLAAASRWGAVCIVLTHTVGVLHIAGETRNEPEQRVADEVVMIVPTSGTTGTPKPIPVHWQQMPFDPASGLRMAVPPESRPPTIHALSMATITGAMGVLRAASRGRALALLERVDLDKWTLLVERFQIRRAGLPPAAMRSMIDQHIPPERLASLKAWQTGSAPLAPDLQREFEATFKVPVLVAYGATEFGGAAASWTLDMHKQWSGEKMGSVGRAIDGVTLKVLDEDSGEELPPNSIGILSVRVPRSAAADDDGWMRTNDRARIDSDGFLFIEGRADDVIVRGGFKVPLGEIESLFRTHPMIRDASAVGLSDRRLGQVPALAVVLRTGATIDVDNLQAWARKRTAPYKVPIKIVKVDALPLGASHKVDRAAVAAMIADEPVAELSR